MIFILKHVRFFRNTAKALLLWVVFSMIYESAKSVLFSIGNPPGNRIISVGFTSAEFTTLVVGGVVVIIAWVMDEGRILNEENKLTV